MLFRSVGVPARLKIVNHEMEPAAGRRGYNRRVTPFTKPMYGIEGFIRLASITGHNEDFRHSLSKHKICARTVRVVN